ncbi:putative lipoprotein [Mycobacterium xenopi 3993]|nr:putative lipoprotein [Mycobacterium xenopi 3993]
MAHRNSKLDRKSSSTSLILSGRSCCSQCPPVDHDLTVRPGHDLGCAVTAHEAQHGSSAPAMNSAGTVMVGLTGSP